MSRSKKSVPTIGHVDPFLHTLLGRTHAIKLRRCIEESGLSQELVLRFGIDLVETHLAHLLPRKTEAAQMGMARWANLPPETRSALARRAVNARWTKYRERKAQQSRLAASNTPPRDETDEK
jgi:hypothetical protein